MHLDAEPNTIASEFSKLTREIDRELQAVLAQAAHGGFRGRIDGRLELLDLRLELGRLGIVLGLDCLLELRLQLGQARLVPLGHHGAHLPGRMICSDGSELASKHVDRDPVTRAHLLEDLPHVWLSSPAVR